MSYPLIQLTPAQIAWARKQGVERYQANPSRTPWVGTDPEITDIIGAMGEVAVCVYYGEDYEAQVLGALANRPRGDTDLAHRGWRVNVKSTKHWGENGRRLTLYVSEHDDNDAYFLVSVDAERGRCGLRGWISRRELMRYPVKGWQGDQSMPGASYGNRYRFVPVQELRPCKTPDVSQMPAPGATPAAART